MTLENIRVHLRKHAIDLNIQFKNVKNVNFRMRNQVLHVSAPRMISEHYLAQILATRVDWAISIQQKINAQTQSNNNQPLHIYLENLDLLEPQTIQLWGHDIQTRTSLHTGNNTYKLDFSNQTIHLLLSVQLAEHERRYIAYKLVLKMYKDQLAQRINGLFVHWEPIVGKKAQEIRIRKMHTRWGSCNVKDKRIWLSTYLAAHPIKCTEYVIVHELCHLHHANHSKDFWHKVAKAMPDYKEYHDHLQGKNTNID